MSNLNKNVRVHYTGTFNDGTVFDSSYDRGQTLDFTCGVGQMIKGFDAAVMDMELGEIRDIHLMPEDAYGPKDPNLIFVVNFTDLPGSESLNVGDQVVLTAANGYNMPVTVIGKTATAISFDGNSEMAGKELNFRIELIDIIG